MHDDQIDYDRINRRVERRLQERKKLLGTAGAFVLVTAIVWTIWLLTSPGKFAWPVIPTVVMGLIALGQALQTFFLSDAMERERDRLLQREIERERSRLDVGVLAQKPKREATVRLSDDGELVYDEPEAEEVRQSRRRGR
jgi:2TM domain